MKIISLSYFRHAASQYEIPACGVNQGIYFSNYLYSVIHAHWAVWGNDWWLEIAHDDRVKELREFRFLRELERNSLIRLRDCGPAPFLCSAMLWRLDPVFDKDVEVVVCRDIDSLPMHRDRKMVEAFIASRGTVHAIHDSESHSGPLMGGMIAVKSGGIPFSKDQWDALKNTYDLSEHGSDQRFLNEHLYPRIASNLLVHTRRPTLSYSCLRSYPAFPQETKLDKAVRHIGAGYQTDVVMKILEKMDYPQKETIERCWCESGT